MNKIPNHILNSVKNGKTSLGHHMAFPPDDEEKFIVRLIKKRYEEVAKETSDFSDDELRIKLGKYIKEVQKIESKDKGAYEKLCFGIINELFNIPQDTIHITPHLVDKVDTSKERLKPENTEGFEFENIEAINRLTDCIYKRRMLNALVEGASLYYTNKIINNSSILSSYDPDLQLLYEKINLCNDYLQFVNKDEISSNEKKYTEAGTVEVLISSNDEMPLINSYGITFPVMLFETFKGILEVACTYGLPDNIEEARYIMKKADFKLAENWDLRIGYPLWEIIDRQMNSIGNIYSPLHLGLNFLFKEIASLPFDDFIHLLQEVFAETKKGKALLKEIGDTILYRKEQDDFDNYMIDKASEFHQLNDSINEYEYFTANDFNDDSDLIEEPVYEIIVCDDFDLINESVTDLVYHFTEYGNLFYIINDNALCPTSNEASRNRHYSNKDYSVSFSRTPNNKIGYAKTFNLPIRFCINGRKLNYIYKGKPISYYYSRLDRQSTKENERLTNLLGKNYVYNEYEDRVFTNANGITNLSDYILSIDIPFYGGIKLRVLNKDIDKFKRLVGTTYGNFLTFYTDRDSFNARKNGLSLIEMIEKYANGDDNTPYGLIGESVEERISNAEKEVNTKPTEAQIKAGNYKKGHVSVGGLDIVIENPKGSFRSGVDGNGNKWTNKMHNTYGYIRRTKMVDGDPIDVFLSDHPTEGDVYVIDQVIRGHFDEVKCMLGFDSYESAKEAYLSNYGKGWKGLGKITKVSWDDFKKWIFSSHRKRKPFSEYETVKKMGTTKTH